MSEIPTDKKGTPAVTNAMKVECMGKFFISVTETCTCDHDPSCGLCKGEGYYWRETDVPWNTIKKIYKAMATVAGRAHEQ